MKNKADTEVPSVFPCTRQRNGKDGRVDLRVGLDMAETESSGFFSIIKSEEWHEGE